MNIEIMLYERSLKETKKSSFEINIMNNEIVDKLLHESCEG